MSAKPVTTPKMVPAKTNPVSKKTVCFNTKPASGCIVSCPTNIKMVTSVWKPTPAVATIGIQDEECIVNSTVLNKAMFTEDKLGNLFQDTSSEDEVDDKWPQSSFQALQVMHPPFKKTGNVMQIGISDKKCNLSG